MASEKCPKCGAARTDVHEYCGHVSWELFACGTEIIYDDYDGRIHNETEPKRCLRRQLAQCKEELRDMKEQYIELREKADGRRFRIEKIEVENSALKEEIAALRRKLEEVRELWSTRRLLVAGPKRGVVDLDVAEKIDDLLAAQPEQEKED